MSTPVMVPDRQQPPSTTEQKSLGHLPSKALAAGPLASFFILLVADAASIAVSLELAIWLRIHLVPHLDSRLQPWAFPFRHYLDYCWLWMVLVVFLAVEGLYTRRRSHWNEVGHLAKAISLGLVVLLAALALTGLSTRFSRATILLTMVNLLILLPIVRFWTKRILGALGLWRKRILILGATDIAKLAIRGLTEDPFLAYEVVGLLDNDAGKKGQQVEISAGKAAYVLGNLSEAREQMERVRARDVLIAMPSLPEKELLALVHELQPYSDSIYVVPQLWALPMMNLQIDGLLRERVMMLRLSNNLAKPWNGWLKRGFDLLMGVAITLLAVPLCLLLGVLILVDSGGPALFVQERLGYQGRNFRCFKFRTMDMNGENILSQYLGRNPQAADEWRKYAKLRNHDPRLTGLGRLLRRWSLDELPQLLNVLRGEMSLVGPRPYLPQERERIGIDLPTILSARPGMTGLWQVSGRNHFTLEERIQLEAWYVRNWTIWLDCIVLAKTFRTVIFPQNNCEPAKGALQDFVPHDSRISAKALPTLDARQCDRRLQRDGRQ
jgi:undecaprenyl-phosphate galactose phosphotransferase